MSAVLSPCGTYRYWLERGEPEAPYVAWILANPSTADATLDDPTVRKARGFTERWGYKRFVFVNVFAGRSTDPRGLLGMKDPVGPENEDYVHKACFGASRIVLAWGNAVVSKLRPKAVETGIYIHRWFAAPSPECLGYTKDRQPRHPLMLPYTTPLEPYELRPRHER